MTRMYEVNGKRVRTWNVFKGCLFECNYCVQRDQANRQKHRCDKCYNYEPHMHFERLSEKFKVGETVFVAAAGDISFATHSQFIEIIDQIRKYPQTTFLLQSKKPFYFFQYMVYPSNILFGTTIETNRNTERCSKAPPTISPHFNCRYQSILWLAGRKFITIEPVMDFDLDIMVHWIKEIAPEFVYVGYLNPLWKAKKLQLPEPSLEKTIKLCKELDKFTEVRLKTIRKGWHEK